MSKDKKELCVKIDAKIVKDLEWLSKHKDDKGELHTVDEIVETALLLTFTTLNVYAKKQKKMN